MPPLPKPVAATPQMFPFPNRPGAMGARQSAGRRAAKAAVRPLRLLQAATGEAGESPPNSSLIRERGTTTTPQGGSASPRLESPARGCVTPPAVADLLRRLLT